MNSLLILFCYNRPTILSECVKTLFGNTEYQFDEVLLIDDGSRPDVISAISQFIVAQRENKRTKFSLMTFGKNQGYSYAAEFAFKYTLWRNPKYLFFIEQDYVFRKGWAEEAIAVLEASPKTVAISGYSNPDYYDKSKTDEMFQKIIEDELGHDPCKREFMHKPFKLSTSVGDIEVQGTSNSCGTCIVNWQNMLALDDMYKSFWKSVIERACNMHPGGNRLNYGDGPFTHGISFYWYNKYKDVDFEKEFPWLDICDYSIANHINGGAESINGKIVPEGTTFVSSPKWSNEYINSNPRRKMFKIVNLND